MKNTENAMNKIKNNIILQILLFAVLMLILFLVYTFALHSIEDDVCIRKELNAPDTALSYISRAEVIGEYIELDGWTMYPDMEITSVDVIFTSLSEETNSLVAKTVLAENESLSDCVKYLGLEETVINGAFSTEIKQKKLNNNYCYRLDVNVTYQPLNNIVADNDETNVKNEYKDTTNFYWYGGELYSYNPLNFTAPNFSDEQMQQVITEGYLCAYNKANGAWVYLYDNSMYWILDRSVESNQNEDLYMYFHLFTTKSELLPEKRRPYHFDNRDFYFKNYELSLIEDSMYRVASMEVSVEYPVTYIDTGEFNFERNVWSVGFELPFFKQNEVVK